LSASKEFSMSFTKIQTILYHHFSKIATPYIKPPKKSGGFQSVSDRWELKPLSQEAKQQHKQKHSDTNTRYVQHSANNPAKLLRYPFKDYYR